MMHKIVLCIAFLLCVTWIHAQIVNPSFEQTDSLGNSVNWTVTQGVATKLSVIQLGIIPFTASDGNFFTLLTSDTQTVNVKSGIIHQQFAMADTPGNFSLNYLYIPQFVGQHAVIKLYFSKWNGAFRDTVLYLEDTISVVADGNIIPIQWNTYAVSLIGKFRNSTLPDSTWIQLQNDDALNPSKNVRLFVDNLQFGKWGVGLNEKTKYEIDYYPNPANTYLTIHGLNLFDKYTIQLIASDGVQYTLTSSIVENKLILNTQDIPKGLYVLSIQIPNGMLNNRIFINHD